MTDDEALRRRLYRPGAGEGDVAAYLSAVADHEQPDAEPGRPVPVRPRRRGRLVALAAGAVVVAAAPFALHRAAAPAPAPPLPAARVDDATAARFRSALDAGADAGLGPWRADGAPYLEAHGVGDGTVPLPVSASGRGGRLVVLLVLDRDAVAGWAAARLVIHDDRTIHLRTEASGVGAVRAGVPVEAHVVYAAEHRPLRLLVRAPAHARWGLGVVFGS